MQRHLTNQDIIRPQSGDRTLAQLDSTLGPFLLTEGEAKSLNRREELRNLEFLRLSKKRVDGGKGRLTDQDMRKIIRLASGQRYEEGFSIQYRNPYSGKITEIPGRFKWRNDRWEVEISNGTFYIQDLGAGTYEIQNPATKDLFTLPLGGTRLFYSGTQITAAGAGQAGGATSTHLLPRARRRQLVGSQSLKF